jgi:hypothetical protein
MYFCRIQAGGPLNPLWWSRRWELLFSTLPIVLIISIHLKNLPQNIAVVKPLKIFILGCGGGSTWVSNILDAHPSVDFYMEPFADYAGIFGFPEGMFIFEMQATT